LRTEFKHASQATAVPESIGDARVITERPYAARPTVSGVHFSDVASLHGASLHRPRPGARRYAEREHGQQSTYFKVHDGSFQLLALVAAATEFVTAIVANVRPF
jgi:hypothetical protein